MTLFHMFRPLSMLRTIVGKTNRYATEVDGNGDSRGGANWESLTVAGLKTFLAVILYMGMKRQPNIRSYWMMKPSFSIAQLLAT